MPQQQQQGNRKYHKSVAKLFWGMLISFILIQVYWLTRPVYDWWTCLMNPAACAGQGAMDFLVAGIAMFVQPVLIFLVFGVWIILRVLKR